VILREKQWPLAIGASLEIVLAAAIGMAIVGTFRGWFTSSALNPDRPADVHALVDGEDDAQSAHLPGARAARRAHP
jgi:hypothetical protein